MNIVKELISKGFKPFRKKYNGKKWVYTECRNNDYFSSSVSGMSDIRLMKGGAEVVFGLNEKGYPPTLLFPKKGDTNKEIERNILGMSIEDIIKQ